MLTSRFSFKYLPVMFSITLFTSAGLLFLIEPMIAKMILPLLGGTPAVWNTCMMFFQAMLLADQSRFWMAGYLTLGILTLCCAYLTWRNLSVCLGNNENTVGQNVTETCMPDSSITIALFLSALLLPLSSKDILYPSKGWRSISIYAGSLIFIGLLSFHLITRWPVGNLKLDWINEFLGMERGTLNSILTYGILALLCFLLVFHTA